MSNGLAIAVGSIIVGVVILFVGLFLVTTVSDTIPCANLYAESSATTTSTQNLAGGVSNANKTLTTNTACTSTGTLYYTIANINATGNGANNGTITIYLNDVSVGTLSVTGTGIPTTTSITGVTLNDGANTVTAAYTGAGAANYTNYTYVAAIFTGEGRSGWGNTYDSTVTSTGTIFSVMGLVLIVVGLAIAIKSLRNSV